MKICFIILVCCFVSCCTVNKQVLDFTVSKYVQVADGYVFSGDVLQYKSLSYRPVITLEYRNGRIEKAQSYKPEGILEYSKSDLSSDSILTTMYSIHKNKILKARETVIIDNDLTYAVSEKISDTNYYCLKRDSLIIYKFY